MQEEMLKIFYDADTLFSSYYSKSGGARAILESNNFEYYTSNICILEASEALKIKYKLTIDEKFINKFRIHHLKEIPEDADFVNDIYDAHVIEAAKNLHANYIITYNLKDYKLDLIKDKLSIDVWNPSKFIFYARNILNFNI